MKRVTIKDIAEMLNISVSTVSRALKDHPDISNAVKLKVKEAAEAFNYIPNDFAINFRKKSSKVIGLIIPEMSMFLFLLLLKGYLMCFTEKDIIFLLSSEESLKMEKENIMTCINSRVDGILISLTKYTKDLSHLQKAKDIELPIVIFDKTISKSFR